MKIWRIVAVLLLCLAMAGSMACNRSDSSQEETSQLSVKVVRGDLTVSVSGAGNIEVANEENLAFEASSGRVDKIYVKVGDKVTKGDVLAELAPLDTDALELSLLKAQTSLTQTQISHQTAVNGLESTVTKKDALELALLNKQLALKTAKHNLAKAEEQAEELEDDIEDAQADVDEAESFLESVLVGLGTATANETAMLSDVVARATASLNSANATLEALSSGYDSEEIALEIATKELQIQSAEMGVSQAQMDIDDLALEIATKELQVEIAKQSLEQAQKSLEQAQKNLDNETITAPWDGVVARVGAKVGDTFHSAAAGTVIVYLIDPAALELPVQVDEIDIPKIKLNQRAVVSIDALPDVKLEGSVTAISPVPAATGGVVLYDVTIGLTAPEGSDLKVGMSATADIIVGTRSNVLLVPTQAIKQDTRGNSIVVIQDGEQLQPRPVVTGLSSGLWTEIVDGLSEGETVVVEITAEARQSLEQRGGQPIMPIMPRTQPRNFPRS